MRFLTRLQYALFESPALRGLIHRGWLPRTRVPVTETVETDSRANVPTVPAQTHRSIYDMSAYATQGPEVDAYGTQYQLSPPNLFQDVSEPAPRPVVFDERLRAMQEELA